MSKSKRNFSMKSSAYYFHMKTKILASFQICISVPLSFQSSKHLKSCLVFFTERSPTLFKVKHLQYYIEGVLFTVPFTRSNFSPISRTGNMWLWRKWDLCANIHTSAGIAMCNAIWNIILNIAYFDRPLGCVKPKWIHP